MGWKNRWKALFRAGRGSRQGFRRIASILSRRKFCRFDGSDEKNELAVEDVHLERAPPRTLFILGEE